MKKYIVCTTINEPTEALKKFADLPDWELIVVADKSTPMDYTTLNCEFMTCEFQDYEYPELSQMLGWRTVDRRNLGFLHAYNLGADVVAMVDDDNIPMANWGEVRIGVPTAGKVYTTEHLAFDPLAPSGYAHWHRGYPISQVPVRFDFEVEKATFTCDVQANLWYVDPDVDAICRMQISQSYNPKLLGYFTSDSISPFNMQNTMISRQALKFCPSIPETGRMCDIWGSYYCQLKGCFNVMYGPPTVQHKQHRSWQSICDDLREEIIGYEHDTLLADMFMTDADEALSKVISHRAFDFVQAYQESFK